MINEFYSYWTEPNKSNTKFKQEMEKTWDTGRRLKKWSGNDFNKTSIIKHQTQTVTSKPKPFNDN